MQICEIFRPLCAGIIVTGHGVLPPSRNVNFIWRPTLQLFVTRRAQFSAAHRLFNPAFTDAQNEAVFDKCNNPRGHGHNYTLEVTVAGMPDPQTGYVIDLKVLAEIMDRELIDKVDHKHLNHDVPFLAGIIPTAENIAVKFWEILAPKITAGTLHSIRVFESDNNYAEYFGAK